MTFFIIWYIIGLIGLFFACGFNGIAFTENIAAVFVAALFGPIVLLVVLFDYIIDKKNK